MAEVVECISSEFLAVKLIFFSFAFSSHFPSSIVAAAEFTRFPPNITEVISPKEVFLEWNYTIGSKSDFRTDSPVWEYRRSTNETWQEIAIEDSFDGWKWKISSNCPPHLRERVRKESVATLVINNTIQNNSGIYRCTLKLKAGDKKSEVQVFVREKISPTTVTTTLTSINSTNVTTTVSTSKSPSPPDSTPPPSKGLSAGEIAAIVIGSLCGLVVGAITGYCIYKKYIKKRPGNLPDEKKQDTEMNTPPAVNA